MNNKFVREGIYVGPAGQLVEIEWSSGPGYGHGGYMYSVNGQCYQELTDEVKQLMEGFEFLGELGEQDWDSEC